MGGFISPSQPKPQPIVQQVMEPEQEPEIDQRDINDIDNIRRRRQQQQPSLLDLLSDGGQSPTIL